MKTPLKKIGFFDLETQYLFRELDPKWDYRRWEEKELIRNELVRKMGLAVAGLIVDDDSTRFYTEENVEELIGQLESVDMIVGHNLLEFDYIVLDPYVGQEVIKRFEKKTFDIIQELRKVTGILISLDDLGKRNLGTQKLCDTLKIPEMWRNGKHDDVKKYLETDLKITKGIYYHGKTKGKIKYTHKEYGEIKGIRTVKVNW